ncbi:MAG TPA: hypothetical protein VEA61_06045 [Allosphingosinicella sp.]|nr:hypothetical protein [Allosphingosinicella sp.]
MRTHACVFIPEEGQQCGFVAVAMNERGDLLACATVEGRVQLWDEAGAVIATLDAAVRGSEQFLFAGDRLFVLTSYGDLLTVDARTGKQLSRLSDLPRDGTLQRLLPGGLLLMRARAEGSGLSDEVLLVSVASGRIVDRRLIGSPVRYASGRDWAAGVTTRQVAEQVWHATLHLADEALTQIEIERWCEPLGPRPVCVRRDVDGPNLYLFDLETRRWSVLDMGEPLIGTTMIDWTQAARRTYAALCELRYIPSSESTYDCRIVDMADGRLVHSFSAARHVMVGATLPGGAPELRIWQQDPGDWDTGTVTRVAATPARPKRSGGSTSTAPIRSPARPACSGPVPATGPGASSRAAPTAMRSPIWTSVSAPARGRSSPGTVTAAASRPMAGVSQGSSKASRSSGVPSNGSSIRLRRAVDRAQACASRPNPGQEEHRRAIS